VARNPELAGLDQAAAVVRERRAALLAISGDNPFVHTASAKKHGFAFPLLSDVHRPVIRAYGVLDEEKFFTKRAYFLIDKQGVVRWKHVEAELGNRREDKELLEQIAKLG